MIIKLVDQVYEAFDKSHSTLRIFLYLSKSFNSTDHIILIECMVSSVLTFPGLVASWQTGSSIIQQAINWNKHSGYPCICAKLIDVSSGILLAPNLWGTKSMKQNKKGLLEFKTIVPL